MPEICHQVEQKTGVHLEHPTICSLREKLLSNGDYDTIESLVLDCCKDGTFDSYLSKQPCNPEWTCLNNVNWSPESGPGMRGGHQMVIDCVGERIFLLGGWDGGRDMSDFWQYDINKAQWLCISQDTQKEGGPGPRSCHKMVLDSVGGRIFVMGKYVDSKERKNGPEALRNDLYLYDIGNKEWCLISEDTGSVCGPRLTRECQMVIDSEAGMIYTFGGRILSVPSIPPSPIKPIKNTFFDAIVNTLRFEHLFSYHIATNTWKVLREDNATIRFHEQLEEFGGSIEGRRKNILSRNGHSMIFCQNPKRLIIIGGQRNKDILTDVMIYTIETDTLLVYERNLPFEAQIQTSGCTQKAVIDDSSGEVYLFVGSNITMSQEDRRTFSALWIYRIDTGEWSCIYNNKVKKSQVLEPTKDSILTRTRLAQLLQLKKQEIRKELGYIDTSEMLEPCHRFGHQIVFDDNRKTYYLFGGNPLSETQTRKQSSSLRLNDFWSLKLNRTTAQTLMHHCQWQIRRAKYMELTNYSVEVALEYLQNDLGKIVDQNDSAELEEFHQLAKHLFDESKPNVTNTRTSLFSTLLEYFPDSMREPKMNLPDLVAL